MENSKKIKAIQTEYNGYKFRSRLEARWAVFFDSAGIEYQYEPEGFESDSKRYLPDFYLPDFDIYVEVKPNTKDSIEDMNRIKKFLSWGGPIKGLLILSDIPPANRIQGIWHFPIMFYSSLEGVLSGWWYFSDDYFGEEKCDGGRAINACYIKPYCFTTIGDTDTECDLYRERFDIGCKWERDIDYRRRDMRFSSERMHEYYIQNKLTFDSYDKARQARFEYGETPKARKENN